MNGRRPDGYHNLQSWVVFADFSDSIMLRESKTFYFLAKGPFANALPSHTENLVTKTIRLMAERYKKNGNFYVELTKNIPIGAGLGGGSSNVAGTLRALQKIWGFTWYQQDAEWLAKNLGADVPMCLYGDACMVGGIGEKLSAILSMPPECHVVMVYPNEPVSTTNVFQMFSPPYTAPMRVQTQCADVVDLVQALRDTRNDLMQATMSQHRVVVRVYRKITQQAGCLMTRMSGSGSTCFGIFADEQSARMAAKAIAAAEPSWWVRATRIYHPPHPAAGHMAKPAKPRK